MPYDWRHDGKDGDHKQATGNKAAHHRVSASRNRASAGHRWVLNNARHAATRDIPDHRNGRRTNTGSVDHPCWRARPSSNRVRQTNPRSRRKALILKARDKQQRLRTRLITVSLSSTTPRRSRMTTDRQPSIKPHLIRRISTDRQRSTTLRAQRVPVMHERQHSGLLRLIPLRLRSGRHDTPRLVKLIRCPRLPPMEPLQRNTKLKRRFYI